VRPGRPLDLARLLLPVFALFTAACASGRGAGEQQSLAADYNKRAEALEKAGRLREALEARKIALTVNPDDADAKRAQEALQAGIDAGVIRHFTEGRAALAKNAHVIARREYLAVLALDPQNRAAFEALRDRTQEVEVFAHTVRAGDTLPGLAQQYYGSRALSEVIAETNQLAPNARLGAGSIVKIPEVPGVPLNRPGARRETPRAPLPGPGGAPAAPAATVPAPAPREEPAEAQPLLADARDSYDRQDYVAALTEVDRFLAGAPGNPEALALKKSVLYSQAKVQFDQKRYDASYATLQHLAKIAPNYENSGSLLRQSRSRLVEDHYTRGIQYYREEKLPEAIAEWRLVLELDPQHAAARRNLEQSERLLKQLEERQK
jgi:tetratricopeptide (TPR) repeat protein